MKGLYTRLEVYLLLFEKDILIPGIRYNQQAN